MSIADNRDSWLYSGYWNWLIRQKGIISSNAIELDLPSSIRIHPVVNVSRIRRYRDQVRGQKVTPPPPVEIQGEMEYEVEKILSKRKRYGKIE